ncbi:MAG: peptidylprolyl isomerase [Bacillota bacterium]|nr:peptidylprolyl isomerase [Bacillota bacterium]
MSEQNILATIDGIQITDADLDAYIAAMPQEQQAYAAYPQFREHCLKQLLAYHLYAKMAEEEKMDETEEFQELMKRARRDILAQVAISSVLKDITVSEEEMQAFYKENPDHFTEGESVQAKHILVDTEEKAQEIFAAIEKGEISFEDAAKAHSSCPSNAQGGDLGEFGRGQMVPEFDQAAFEAEIGKVIGPVKTQFGYHLIRVESKKEASVMEFDTVKDHIQGTLLQQKQNEVYSAKYHELHEKYVK